MRKTTIATPKAPCSPNVSITYSEYYNYPNLRTSENAYLTLKPPENAIFFPGTYICPKNSLKTV